MLTSDIVLLRRRQYKTIGLSYLIAQILSLVEFVVIIVGEKPTGLHGCSIPCMIPMDNTAAALRMMFTLTGLAPTQLFLISFYWLPRKFFHNAAIKDMSLCTTPSYKRPLLFSEEQKETEKSEEERKESGFSFDQNAHRGTRTLSMKSARDDTDYKSSQ